MGSQLHLSPLYIYIYHTMCIYLYIERYIPTCSHRETHALGEKRKRERNYRSEMIIASCLSLLAWQQVEG